MPASLRRPRSRPCFLGKHGRSIRRRGDGGGARRLCRGDPRRQLGLKTAIVEREHLGGICLNWGCIPTKALLRTAEIYDQLQHAEDFGLGPKDIGFDFAKMVDRSRKVAKQLSAASPS